MFLFYGDMTKMNVGMMNEFYRIVCFLKVCNLAGTIQSGTVAWMCVIVIDIDIG